MGAAAFGGYECVLDGGEGKGGVFAVIVQESVCPLPSAIDHHGVRVRVARVAVKGNMGHL